MSASHIQKLEAQLERSTAPHQVIDLITSLAWELRYTDPQRAITLCETAYQKSSSGAFALHPYLHGWIESLRHLGYLYSHLGDLGHALSSLFEAQTLCEAQPDMRREQVDVLYNIGATYRRLNDYPEALAYLLKALNLARKIDDPLSEAAILNVLGNVQASTGDYNNSANAYQTSLRLFQKLGDTHEVGKVYNNMAMLYLLSGNYRTALRNGQNSLKLARQLGDTTLEIYTLDTLGRIYLETAEYEQARHYLRESLTLSRQIGNRFTESAALLNLGRLYLAQSQTELALNTLTQGLAVAEAINKKSDGIEYHRLLAEMYERRGDQLQNALMHYKQFQIAKEDIFNQEANQKLKTLQVLYETETAKKEAEISHLKNVALEQEIVERKRAETELRAIHQELQQKNRQLQELNASKDKFFAIISHDLRSSFNSLFGITQILVEHIDHYTEKELRRKIHSLHVTVQKLYSLLENLLTWSRMQRGLIDYTPQVVRLSGLVEECMTLFAEQAEHKHIVLKTTVSPQVTVYADKRMVATILRNLISNALKFTNSHGEIKISAIPRKEYVEVAIQDNGQGIEANTLEQLFRLDAHSTSRGTAGERGTGLGLILCKEFIAQQGGTIRVESQPGQGSVFTFTLPSPRTEAPYE